MRGDIKVKLSEIIKQPVIRTLEKDKIWYMIDELYFECRCDTSDDYDLEKNTEIKMNILMDEWNNGRNIEVYTIIFEDKIIGVGGSIGDNEDTFNHEIHFIDEQGYTDMMAYLYRLRVKNDISVKIESLDFDFKL